MLGMGQIYDYFGSYELAQVAAIVALIMSAGFTLAVKLPHSRSRESTSQAQQGW